MQNNFSKIKEMKSTNALPVFAHVGSANTWSGLDFEILVWMEVKESKSEMFKLNDFVQRYIQSVTILRKSRQSFHPPKYDF